MTVDAGWYPDTASATPQMRWYDGIAWSGNIHIVDNEVYAYELDRHNAVIEFLPPFFLTRREAIAYERANGLFPKANEVEPEPITLVKVMPITEKAEPQQAHYEHGVREFVAGQGLISKVMETYIRRNRLARIAGVRPIPHESDSWYKGGVGERNFGRELSRLPEGWVVFHSLPIGKKESDIDHVIVGPAGVYTVNTKNIKNNFVVVNKDWVNLDGRYGGHNGKRWLDYTKLESDRVAEKLLKLTGIAISVRPTLIFAGNTAVRVRSNTTNTYVGHLSGFVNWLVSHPRVFDDEQLAIVTRVLDDPKTWGIEGAAPLDESIVRAFDGLEKELKTAVSRRRGWTLLAVFGFLGGLYALMLFVYSLMR